MDKDNLVQIAMRIEGATFPIELYHLYDLALQAPENTQFVELGSYHGRTFLVIAYAAKQRESHAISIDNYLYDESGSKASSVETVERNLKGSKIELGEFSIIQGDSRNVPELINRVGFLFIDSTHTRDHFDQEMRVWLDHVVKDGIIACHDYASPRWVEMTGAIDAWFSNNRYKFLGLKRRTIGYKKLV